MHNKGINDNYSIISCDCFMIKSGRLAQYYIPRCSKEKEDDI